MCDSEEESFASVDDADEEKISEPALEEAAVNVCASAEPAGTPTGAVEEASTAKPSDELAGNSAAATSGASDLDTSTTETSAGHEADSVGALAKPVEDDTNKVPAGGWGWGSWSSWGSSVLNTAASSVGTFTSQVGEGFYQVLETVESGLLADDEDADNNGDVSEQKPATADPELEATEMVVSQEMVRHANVDEMTPDDAAEAEGHDTDELKDTAEALEPGDSWLTGWKLPVLSDVVNKTSSVMHQTMQQTSNVSMKVIGGGIDVLEAIGRKTYDVLAEGEHGLKKTIVKSRENRPTLSQTLREAKTLAESREQEEEAFVESRKSNFGAQFDDFQGLVQLEALESLNSSSEQKVRRFIEMLPRDAAESIKSELLQIRQLFDDVHAEQPDDDDVTEQNFDQLVTDYFGRLNLNAGVQKLLACQTKVQQITCSLQSDLHQSDCTEKKTSREIHQMAVQSLAEMTACAMEHWHRVGQQLLLVSLPQQSFHSIANELAGVCKVLCREVSLRSTTFVNCLTAKSNDETDSSASELITGVYLESSNAADYIRNGFSLLLPVLQLAVIKAHPLFTDNDN